MPEAAGVVVAVAVAAAVTSRIGPPAAGVVAAADRPIEAGKAALKPGAVGWEVDAAGRNTITRWGYPEYQHGLGHQIGRSAHDGSTLLAPRWERYGQTPFGVVEEGNVFTLELGVHVPGRGYIGQEEDMLVTATGCEYLSTPQTELWCV